MKEHYYFYSFLASYRKFVAVQTEAYLTKNIFNFRNISVKLSQHPNVWDQTWVQTAWKARSLEDQATMELDRQWKKT